jgi:hypothetical protein
MSGLEEEGEMPRSKIANENSPTSGAPNGDRQELVDLVAYHLARLGPKQISVAAIKADVDEVIAEAKQRLSEAQQQLTDMFLEAKSDTRIERDTYERAIKAQRAGARKAAKDREVWDVVCEAAGIPFQLELLGDGGTPTLAKDELAWEAEGYLAGRRGDDATAPKGCTGDNLQAFMRGYHKGQEENGLRLGRAQKIIEARATPQTDAPVNLNEDDEDEDEKLDDAARKLKASGFMQRGADDAGAEAGAAA